MSKVFTIADGLENLGALRTGGQGSVYKGRRTGTIYSAVKLIPTPVYAEDGNDTNYRNFKNEVAKLEKVNEIPNPNIVKMLSWGVTESGSFPFIEMEYIEGPDLSELLQPPHDKIFTLKELLKVADQLACALSHCHKVGVKHGDVKSNNVKYNNNTGNYVLLDFGLAIMSEEQRRSSIRNAGAVEFMAPEQHDGVMLTQTDVYSYGVILFELLTGQVPFPLLSSNDTARNNVMAAHLEREIPNALELRKANLPDSWSADKKTMEMQVPAWLLELIVKCLKKKPEERFTDASQLHDAIIKGSLSVVSHEAPVVKPASLLAQNEKLQNQLQAQSDPQKIGLFKVDKNVVHIRKGLFTTLVALSVLFMAMTAYSFFSSKEPVYPASTATGADLKPYKSILFIKPINTDSIRRAKELARIQTLIDSANAITKKARENVRKAQAKKIPPGQAKKRKRKKFLGIF